MYDSPHIKFFINYLFTLIHPNSSSIGVSLHNKLIFNLTIHFLSLTSVITHSFPSNGPLVTKAVSPT